MSTEDSFNRIFTDKNRILVIMAHPDDAEIYCGGTIARLTSLGKIVRVVKMTNGDKGSKQEKISQTQLRQIRQAEDKKSMNLLGIKSEDNVYLDLGDGHITNSLKIIEKIAFQIRQFKPDIIITHNPQDMVITFDESNSWVNHRDHRNTGKSAIDAAYPYSRDLLFFPKHFQDPSVTSHQVSQFLLVDYYHHPETVFAEMTNFVDAKINSIAAHSSQYSFEDAKSSTDFFSKHPDGKRYECFRYVVTD
jgi:LmbE family N-acetylglucosaminyl deacetylase